ncbi:MAG: asparagine synthase (glutamine-hydrolyzing) [Verrucomicrobia bacterium]|nr:asparagine synthase (glutamine-hydrolyzing) [Verrucomicrobiota bacterium]
MCGICGLIQPGAVDEMVVRKMAAVLDHRGPDDEGFWFGAGVGIGQRRLSIIDLEGGRQPIPNRDETVWLVCNGEIYNSPGLRHDLSTRGYPFRTKTDVEVILHLYDEHGADCVKHLRGMFAFALWDTRRKRLMLARDHVGQKPMFFHHDGERFAFGSEVKAVMQSGLVRPKPDLRALWHYISLRFIPDRMTLFEGVQKLPAASTLVYENGRVTIERYWRPDYRDKLPNDERAIEEGLHDLLRDTVRMHMLSDVRVGSFLSGGIDSSTITAMAATAAAEAGQSREPVPTFSIGVREMDFNELPYAKMVADRYGTEHHEEVVEADLVHLIPSMVWHMDEPSDPFGVGVYLVSRLAAKTVKVALGGDGGDELFAGYDRFSGNRLVDYYCILPRWFRDKVMRRLVKLVPDSYGYKSLAQKARWANEMSFLTHGRRYAQSMSFLRFTDEAKRDLYTEHARAAVEGEDSAAKVLEHFEAGCVEDLVDRMLYTDLMTRLPDHLLVILDRMAMAHGLEGRPPIVDYRVVEYAASIPASLKLKGKTLKYILKRVASRYLPRELITRRKQGFGFPLAQWMRQDLAPYVRGLMAESRFVDLGLFERGTIARLLDEHIGGRADHNFRIWILINLEMWYRLFFEGQTVDELRALTDRLLHAKSPVRVIGG